MDANDSNATPLESLFEQIEEAVGNAYEIGHFHGRNLRSDEGWGLHYGKIKELILEYIDLHSNAERYIDIEESAYKIEGTE